MKYFILVIILCFSNCEKKSFEKLNNNNADLFINDSLKHAISKFCIDKFYNAHIYNVTFTKLYKTTVIFFKPIQDSEYIKYAGCPVIFFEDKGSLFLVYCGLDRNMDSNYVYSVKYKFDSVCNKYANTEMIIKDVIPSFFMRLENNKLISLEKDQDFYYTFFEMQRDTNPFIPPKIVYNDSMKIKK